MKIQKKRFEEFLESFQLDLQILDAKLWSFTAIGKLGFLDRFYFTLFRKRKKEILDLIVIAKELQLQAKDCQSYVEEVQLLLQNNYEPIIDIRGPKLPEESPVENIDQKD